MNYETINYEISLWKGSSLILDGVSMVQAIRRYWSGTLALNDLFIKLIDLSLTLINRYFNKDKGEAVARAYETFGLSCRNRKRRVVLKRYMKLTAIYHPDKGGSAEKMRDINVARDIILESL